MNKVLLVGRLTADPRLEYTANGTARAHFQVAVDRRFGRNGERQADFVSVTCWGKLAEVVGNNLRKGRRVGVEGSLRVDRVGQGTEARTYVTVQAEAVEFLDAPKSGAKTPSGDGDEDDWGDE